MVHIMQASEEKNEMQKVIVVGIRLLFFQKKCLEHEESCGDKKAVEIYSDI